MYFNAFLAKTLFFNGHWLWGIRRGQGERERGMVRQAHQPGKRGKIKFIAFPFSPAQ